MTDYTPFVPYKRKGTILARPYLEGEVLAAHVTVRDVDREAGSPKLGDMIAKAFDNEADEWLITSENFEKDYEL